MSAALKDWDHRIGRRLKLRDLHILSTVVQWGSMGKGAAHLSMTQPAVSDAIAKLEDTLRVRLLERTSKGVLPTIYGTALLKRGAVAFDELRQGIRDIEFLADPTVGEVRVGCSESLLTGFLSTAIDRLSLRYPRIAVRVIDIQPTATEYRLLRDRDVDFMLGRVFDLDPHGEVDAEILFQDRYLVAAGVNSPWTHRRKIALAELANERWIHMPHSVIAAAFLKHGIDVQKNVVSYSHHLRNELLVTGRFLTVIAGSVLRANANRWGLKALPVDLNIRPHSVAVFTLRNRILSPVVGLFIDHVRELAKAFQRPTKDRHGQR